MTPNAYALLGIFVMALKMMGCELNVDTFIWFQEIMFDQKKIKDLTTREEVLAEYGSLNFVPKTRGIVSIVPTY